jgi:hypothetical protein
MIKVIGKLWTQRYYNGTSGIPYNNGVGFISCLLYLEFDYMEHIPTRFYSPLSRYFFGNIPIQYVDVREGEMLIFPSILSSCMILQVILINQKQYKHSMCLWFFLNEFL